MTEVKKQETNSNQIFAEVNENIKLLGEQIELQGEALTIENESAKAELDRAIKKGVSLDEEIVLLHKAKEAAEKLLVEKKKVLMFLRLRSFVKSIEEIRPLIDQSDKSSVELLRKILSELQATLQPDEVLEAPGAPNLKS